MFDAPDYELAWPRDLFVAEASALIASGHATDEDRVGCLLEEAFTSSGPWDDFTAAPSRTRSATFDDPWAVPPGAAEIEAARTPSVAKAEEGEDAGRLVHVIDDDRRALVEQVLRSPDPKAGNQVQHAIALFRGRTSTVQDKRSAVVALAHVLESRRALLKTELLRGDEGALFHIANGFAIRHESESQKADYDPVFLDWVFWWYLATVELSDRLLARANQ